MAEVENISIWNTKQVVNWFKGLDDALQGYIPNLEEACITGAQLLALNYEDLNNLGVLPAGHQELVIEATDLLKQLHFNLDTENLQSHALNLNCRCRALRSSISSRRRNIEGYEHDSLQALQRGSPISLLRLSADVLDSAKILVMWLDRPPFMNRNDIKKVRASIVKLGHELSTTMQQTVFACVIEDAALSICSEIEVTTNRLIVSNDPMTIQPASLEVVHLLNREPSSGLGLSIKTTFEGYHVITDTKEGSISSRIRRIAAGDEVVAVSGQTVIAWQLCKVVGALKNSPEDVAITLKKRPNFSSTSSSAAAVPRRQQPERILTVPPPISPIRKVADSRNNSLSDITDGMSTTSSFGIPSLEVPPSSKKLGGKKKKLKKQKAKSSGNISKFGDSKSELKSRPLNSQRDSMNSFGSSHDSSMRSNSSTEGNLSMASGVQGKHSDIKKNLEHILARDRSHSPLTTHGSPSAEKRRAITAKSDHHNFGKARHKSLENVMKPLPKNVELGPALKDVNSNRLKRSAQQRSKSQSQLLDSKQQEQKSNSKWYDDKPIVIETPASPLDFLVIPPPPQAPYTPRKENVMSVSDVTKNSSINVPVPKALESPNSLLDIEHRRRFTVIGSEQMDEKWYEALLSEINSGKAKRARHVPGRQVLEKLEESKTSDESVFYSSKGSVNDKVAPTNRPQKPLRHRPMSMPPNYYSPIKLRQLRATHAAKANPTLTTIPDEIPTASSTNISPVAHVEEQGVKKLAPLNFNTDSPDSSSPVRYRDQERKSPGHRHSWYNGSPNNNSNNNNIAASSNSAGRSKVPPKPPPRSSSVTHLTNQSTPLSSETQVDHQRQVSLPTTAMSRKEQIKPMDDNRRLQVETKNKSRPLSTGDDGNRYVGLLKIMPNSVSDDRPSPTSPTGRNRSLTDFSGVVTPPPASKSHIADELTKYWVRKQKNGTESTSDPFSPSVINSPDWTRNDAFLSPKQSSNITSPTAHPRVPIIPPVAKPRSKSKIDSSSTSIISPPAVVVSPSEHGPEVNNREINKERSFSVDSVKSTGSTLMSPTTPPSRRKSEGAPTHNSRNRPPVISQKPTKKAIMPPNYQKSGVKDPKVAKLRSSPTSRGSYVAAIDVGYALENVRKNAQNGSAEQKKDSVPQHSENYNFKIIGGVQVRLRKGGSSKSGNKKSSEKKGRITELNDSQSSPDMRSQRRISCRDLGRGECDGWLWKKKSNANSPLSSKWSKRWVVLKDGAVYCYRTPDDEKAESYIGLPGYKITPAVESKKRFAFRVVHPKRKTFYFASDRQMDMSRWMNKMGLAAIEYAFSKELSARDSESPNSSPEKSADGQTNYYSESDPDDTFATSGESSNQSSLASRHKIDSSKPRSITPEMNVEAKSRAYASEVPISANRRAARHTSTQAVLNKSARFPANKARRANPSDIETVSTQTTDSLGRTSAELQRDAKRNRSKSEAAVNIKLKKQENRRGSDLPSPGSSASLSALEGQGIDASPGASPFTSPRKKPAVTADQRKHKAGDPRKKQYLDIGPLSHSLESLNSTKSGTENDIQLARSQEELSYLKNVAVKKAEEVSKREGNMSSASSVSSNQSSDYIQSAERINLFSKNPKKKLKNAKKSKGKAASFTDPLDPESRIQTGDQASPKVTRRDGAGRPRLKVDTNQTALNDNPPQKSQKDSSIDDLCKILQNAEVDIHGVNRRATLRRKMTILSRDPKKNDSLLKKRALQRQLKALQGELEYINNLLEQPTLTSQQLHAWINQHPSLVADLGTIRRLSKNKRKRVGDDAFTKENENNSPEESGSSKNYSDDDSSNVESVTESIATGNKLGQSGEAIPVPTIRKTSAVEKDELNDNVITNINENTRLNSEISTPETIVDLAPSPGPESEKETSPEKPTSLSVESFSKPRPRSCAFSTYGSSPMKLRARTPSPGKEEAPQSQDPQKLSPSKKPYLETDL